MNFKLFITIKNPTDTIQLKLMLSLASVCIMQNKINLKKLLSTSRELSRYNQKKLNGNLW